MEVRTRTVVGPVEALAKGVPLVPPTLTLPEPLADWVEAATEELRSKRCQGPVVEHVLATRGLPEGLVAEFGVFRGSTLRRIAEALPGRTVFGFDSFEGFPEDWDLAYGLTSKKDFFDLGGDLPGEAPENV